MFVRMRGGEGEEERVEEWTREDVWLLAAAATCVCDPRTPSRHARHVTAITSQADLSAQVLSNCGYLESFESVL